MPYRNGRFKWKAREYSVPKTGATTDHITVSINIIDFFQQIYRDLSAVVTND